MTKVPYNNPFKDGQLINPGIGYEKSKKRRADKLKQKRNPLCNISPSAM